MYGTRRNRKKRDQTMAASEAFSEHDVPWICSRLLTNSFLGFLWTQCSGTLSKLGYKWGESSGYKHFVMLTVRVDKGVLFHHFWTRLDHQSVCFSYFSLSFFFPPFDEDMTNDNLGFSAWCSPGGASAGQKRCITAKTTRTKRETPPQKKSP
ncbi:hypothetical protein M440DRAFT_225572 [Trichoderma longibrachiatum ATCC 18648]|uniref:Uncharacterized protein n=1 Tax=Trichoderma longibrachiatum ATCC 18648 TaxID=983965 RepID=A0A2T4CBT5_TRILO|nr:hypothetical protein M440DRAFT_225572 [Trichoderma longibrachiatum ATCC 18648]